MWLQGRVVYARKLKQTLEHVGTGVERAKETYNGKVHGDSFEAGDLVWLNNPVVPRGVQGNCIDLGVARLKW